METLENDFFEGNYIDFISTKADDNNDFNNDFLVFYVFSLNQKVGINIIKVLQYENVNISDYTLKNKEMVLEMFIDPDIIISNDNKFGFDYQGLYISSDSENSSVSLNNLSNSNSLSNLVSHKIKMNSGLENKSNIYCYFNSAIHMFIHDIKIRNAIKLFDENFIIDNESPDLFKYHLMNYFKQLIIFTESKNCIKNTNNITDILKKIRDLFISEVTINLDINHGQEDSNEVYNILFSFLKNNSNLIPNNSLFDALNFYGTNVCTMKCLVCKNCNSLNNRYLKNDVIKNIYNEIRIEQPQAEILEQFIDNKLSLSDALNYYQTSATEIQSEPKYMQPCIDCYYNSALFNHQKRIVKYPQILTISMQRFDYNNGNNLINPFMHFPLQISLKDLELVDVDTLSNFENYLDQFDNKSVYYLSKFVQHRGDSLDFGHYHAYVLDPFCNLWYCYNDNIVTLMTPKEIEKEIETNINKGIQYAFYEKDIINNNITNEGIYNLLLLLFKFYYYY